MQRSRLILLHARSKSMHSTTPLAQKEDRCHQIMTALVSHAEFWRSRTFRPLMRIATPAPSTGGFAHYLILSARGVEMPMLNVAPTLCVKGLYSRTML